MAWRRQDSSDNGFRKALRRIFGEKGASLEAPFSLSCLLAEFRGGEACFAANKRGEKLDIGQFAQISDMIVNKKFK